MLGITAQSSKPQGLQEARRPEHATGQGHPRMANVGPVSARLRIWYVCGKGVPRKNGYLLHTLPVNIIDNFICLYKRC